MIQPEQVPDLVRECGLKVVGAGAPVGRKLLPRVDDDVGLAYLARASVKEELRVADASAREEGVVLRRVRDGNQADAVAPDSGARRLFVSPDNDEAHAGRTLPTPERAAYGPLHVAARLDVRR